jgi:nucleoside-diphosphate-sugar epimerase
MSERVLVIGANGQIGSELVDALGVRHGPGNVIAADIGPRSLHGAAHYETVDVLDSARLRQVIDDYGITQVCQMAAMLSVTAESAPLRAWRLNTDGLLNVLEIARTHQTAGKPLKIFWPSSIAAFGPGTPAQNAPQVTVMDPTTIYGISKLAGERLCDYYFQQYGVDVRSLRYPGIVSYKAPPGGGTTDYAIAIFHAAQRGEIYRCFLGPDTTLPMMFMSDALRATVELLDAPADRLKVRSSYNLAGLSFSPRELTAAIRQQLPEFQVEYDPDDRQAIADAWPQSIDDSAAQADWGWRASVSLAQMVDEMLANISGSDTPRA